MARQLRIDIANGLYHVTSRGWERRVIVRGDDDREDWVRLLDRVATRRGWRVFAWALLNNHFHLFLRTPDPNLSAGMHDLNSGYASLFNRRHRRVGSLFQGRFKGILVEDETHGWEVSRYVHLNAVRARIVEHPRDYRWSSYPAYLDKRLAQSWLDWETVVLEHAPGLSQGRRHYRRFVEAGIGVKLKSPLRKTVGGIFLGSPEWVEKMRRQLTNEADDPAVPTRRRLAIRPSPASIVALVLRHFGEDESILQVRRRRDNDARMAAIYLQRRLTDVPVSQLAQDYGGVSTAAISKLVQRAEQRRGDDRTWDRLLSRLEQQLRFTA